MQAEVTTFKGFIDRKRSDQGKKKDESVGTDLITVDVKGAVKSPGIYDLPVGSRVNDAVQKAGGLTEQADSKSPLAQKSCK